ncbi:MAG: hypothetical protein QIT40_gp06 [Lokiarchaeia virus VerdaV4]|uniref:Uncharacterized protein n=1 Tax=Lokiarchaeia virus VerdaV4 TaxID=3070172 RepID=A0AA35GAJ0_9CAUD|nr:MAG: hypothetical protein QIT40_gp06 [Lokiarchaeia virus VerdaV4]BDI54964.1 MAG: hypothetical protein [Lokiarchaeia virus VerdaV4]
MSEDKIEPDKSEPEPQPETERDDKGKFKKKEPTPPEEPEKKEEPEAPKEPNNEDYKKQIETLNKELVELRRFKTNRMKQIDDHEERMKKQRTKEDQKLKGFKEEKKSEGDQTVTPPLYKKMSFKNLTETSKKMRKK